MAKTRNRAFMAQGIGLVLTMALVLNACDQKAADAGDQKPSASPKTTRLVTAAGKQIDDIQLVYVSTETNWKRGSNIIRTRLAGNEGVIVEIPLADIKEVHITRVESGPELRKGPRRLEVDYVKATETVKGISFPLGAFAVQFYMVLPDEFRVSELSEYFRPLAGFHVNPEYKVVNDRKWLRVPLAQVKSLYK